MFRYLITFKMMLRILQILLHKLNSYKLMCNQLQKRKFKHLFIMLLKLNQLHSFSCQFIDFFVVKLVITFDSHLQRTGLHGCEMMNLDVKQLQG